MTDQPPEPSQVPPHPRVPIHVGLLRYGTPSWNLAAAGYGLVAFILGLLVIAAYGPFPDTRSFWLGNSGPLYDPGLPITVPRFNYSPVMALVLLPLGRLPWPAFAVLWTACAIAAYAWLLRPLEPIPRLVGLMAGTVFALNGNIEWGLAVVAVVGQRYPSSWLVAAFTKVAPFIGFGWFLIRREWRSVARTAAIGLALALCAALLLPGAWPTWIGMLIAFTPQASQGGGLLSPAVPLAPRLLAAMAVMAWGSITERPWTWVLVLMLAQPDLQPWMLGYAAALPRLLKQEAPQRRRRPRDAMGPVVSVASQLGA